MVGRCLAAALAAALLATGCAPAVPPPAATVPAAPAATPAPGPSERLAAALADRCAESPATLLQEAAGTQVALQRRGVQVSIPAILATVARSLPPDGGRRDCSGIFLYVEVYAG